MKTRRGDLKGMSAGLILTVLGGSNAFAETALTPASARDIIATMRPFPASAKTAVDSLLAFANGTRPTFTPGLTRPLVDFISSACTPDSGWELPERDGAAGAAYVVMIKTPLQQYLALNFHPDIPDYAVFPSALRYSAYLNSNAMHQAYARIATDPTGTDYTATGHLLGMEEITPNPESGSYFSYTNSRTFLRCKVADRDVLFSCSETLAPSTFSNRGVPVGPLDQALFYYSGKPGLNLSGMTWMLSRITRSTTLSVYIALSSNETAVATFAWLNAGWKGVNVTRASHILNSQISTLDFSRRIAQHPAVSAPVIASIVDSVNGLPSAALQADYARYLAYVQRWRDQDKQGVFCRSTFLQELYNPKENQDIPLRHQRALIIQERVRTLLGIPTWSVNTETGIVAKH